MLELVELETPKYTDIVIDLETWSLRPTAAIRSIGAVAFNIASDPETPLEYSAYYRNVLDFIGDRDPKTIEWWHEQSKEAQEAMKNNQVSLFLAIPELMQFIEAFSHKISVRIWSNGAAFDIPIIRNACATCENIEPVWSYKNERDTRTLYWLCGGVEVPRVGVHHNAIDDATNEAMRLRKAYDKLNKIQSS